MSARSGQRASVTADELNSGEDAAVEAAICVHEWVQNGASKASERDRRSRTLSFRSRGRPC